MREFAPSQLNPPPPHTHTHIHILMHVFGCKPARKWPFPALIRGGQLLLLDSQIISRLCREDTCKHSLPTSLIQNEENIHLVQVMLRFKHHPLRWNNCVRFHLRRENRAASGSTAARCQALQIILTLRTCLNYLWIRLLTVCGGNILFSSLLSKHRRSAPSKTHTDYCVFSSNIWVRCQIFRSGIRFSTWTASRRRRAAGSCCTHTHTHGGCNVRGVKEVISNMNLCLNFL